MHASGLAHGLDAVRGVESGNCNRMRAASKTCDVTTDKKKSSARISVTYEIHRQKHLKFL